MPTRSFSGGTLTIMRYILELEELALSIIYGAHRIVSWGATSCSMTLIQTQRMVRLPHTPEFGL